MKTTLLIEKSHLRKGWVFLRNRETGSILHPHPSANAAARYCRQNGYGYTFPMPRLHELLTKDQL